METSESNSTSQNPPPAYQFINASPIDRKLSEPVLGKGQGLELNDHRLARSVPFLASELTSCLESSYHNTVFPTRFMCRQLHVNCYRAPDYCNIPEKVEEPSEALTRTDSVNDIPQQVDEDRHNEPITMHHQTM